MQVKDYGGLRYGEMSQHPRERPSPDLLLTAPTKLFLMTLHGCISLTIHPAFYHPTHHLEADAGP